MSKCDISGYCKPMHDAIFSTDRKTRGLDVVEIVYLNTDERKRAMLMVIHRKSGKDCGTVLNFCPWCGGPAYWEFNRDGEVTCTGTEVYREHASMLDEGRRANFLVRKHLGSLLHVDPESMSAVAMAELVAEHLPPLTDWPR